MSQTKVAIVTGASSGIGKATVARLLSRGFAVHAAARRVEAMRDVEALGAQIHYLDLTQLDSIDAFVADVLRASGSIDLLVNNAGYGAYGAVEDVPIGVARAQMDVNLFGLAQLIRATLPTMRRQRSGTIVNVTSIGGKVWSLFGAWYQASKFAVEGLSDCLRNELRPFGINVVVVEPGGIDTEWGTIAAANMRRHSGTGPYRALVAGAARIYGLRSGAKPALIAEVICKAATAKRPKPRYVAPLSGRIILWLRWVLNDRAFDWLFSRVFAIPARIRSY